MRNGTLSNALRREREKSPLPGWNATRKSICLFGIVATMAYIHDQHIIHRDLKPENVFLNDGFEPYLADFGISRHCMAGSLEKTAALGTPLYMSPELFSEDGMYGKEVDVYAFAITCYQFFAAPTTLDDNPRPFRDTAQLFRRVQKGARFVRLREIPDFHWSVIERCWKQAPTDRPTFLDLLEEFRSEHAYRFPGANEAELLEYEERILNPFESQEADFENRLNRFLDDCEENGTAQAVTSVARLARLGSRFSAPARAMSGGDVGTKPAPTPYVWSAKA
jgi:serine/threonine protein kinase